MSAQASSDPEAFERLLRQALAPVDPPADLGRRVESTLVSLTEAAQEELESWELRAMRDPRNWVRPVAATVVGATAGTALVVLRVRSRQQARKRPPASIREFAEQTVKDLTEETRRILG